MSLTSRIKALASALIGAEVEGIAERCAAAELYVKQLLRSGVDPESIAEVYTYACAALAAAMEDAVSDGVTRFDAGTLSLSFSDKNGKLFDAAMRMLAPWCKSSTAFLGVRG